MTVKKVGPNYFDIPWRLIILLKYHGFYFYIQKYPKNGIVLVP